VVNGDGSFDVEAGQIEFGNLQDLRILYLYINTLMALSQKLSKSSFNQTMKIKG
jgi:hypothetical protein